MSGERIAYSQKEAAGMLSIGLRTLQKLIAAGEIRAIHIGSRSLVPKDELEKFLKHALKAAQ